MMVSMSWSAAPTFLLVLAARNKETAEAYLILALFPDTSAFGPVLPRYSLLL